MEPLFSMETVMTVELFMRYYKINEMKNGIRWFTYIVSLVCCVMGILFLLVFDRLAWAAGALSIGILCPLSLLLASFASVRMFKKSIQRVSGKPYSISFFAGEYIENSPWGEAHISYHNVYRILESKDMLLVYQRQKPANIVDKSKMTRGTAEELSAFLRETCSASYSYVGK